MKGIEVPHITEDFTADAVELFFDLGFVLAFAQLVGHLVHHPDLKGVGEVVLLFLLMWLPWSQFTWAANAVSGNSRTVRLLFLVGTAITVPMAASVSTAFGAGGPVFAISLGAISVIALGMMVLGIESGSDVFRSVVTWASLILLLLAVLIFGAFLTGPARVGVWLVAMGIFVYALWNAGGAEWIIRPGHMAERHGLIYIIALGEVMVAIALPVVAALEDGQGLPALTVIALIASGAFAGLLWWAYFDRLSPGLEYRADLIRGNSELGRFARDVYTIAHAPIVAGVIFSAAALEEIALHPGEPVAQSFRLMLAAGLLMGAIGVGVAAWRAFGVFARERIASALIIAVVLLVGGRWNGVTLLMVVVTIMGVLLVAEHRRIERDRAAAAPAGS